MKKKIYAIAALTVLLMTGCSANNTGDVTNSNGVTEAPDQGATGTTDNANKTYEVTSHGYGGELTVSVETSEGKITDLTVVSHKETNVVFDRAWPIIKERILEAQSPIVDSVSGATFSSYAVKSAVAEAMKQEGQDFGTITFATQGPESPERQLEAVNTQLVIVGGGPAGLAAAIEAKQNGIEDVILIEKLDILSGNGKFDMNFYDLINSEAQKANGIEDTVEAYVNDMKDTAWDTPERLLAQAEGSYVLDEWLREFGVNLNYNYGGRNHMAEANRYAGEHIQEKMEEKVNDLGVDVRTGTKGLDLIMEDNKVVGVKVQNKNDYYDIYADAVIIATGGFSNNKELLAKYVPGSEKLATSNQMGTTGDFIPVFEKYNIALDHMDTIRIFKTIISNRRDLTGGGDGAIFVNKDGERFIDETKGELEMGTAILEQPDGKVFYIYDQDLYEASYRLQKHTDLGYHVKADSLEELAEKLGINAENLAQTIETFNKAVDGEIADPFRETAFTDKIDLDGPIYGVQIESAVHMTKGGVLANEKAEILNNDGEVVQGLYAAGEVASSSAAYSAAVVFGRISGEEAANYILNK